MKFNYFLIALFFSIACNSQVVVTNSNIKINNLPISNNTISFDSGSSVNLSLDVQLLTSDGSANNTLGNLFLYYKESKSGQPIQIGFQAVTFVNNFPKTDYIANFSFKTVTLYKNAFFATGGFFYVEYKNSNEKIFLSNNVDIKGGTKILNPSPNPSPNTYSAILNNINYSDNLPIVNNKILIPNNLTRSIDATLTMDPSYFGNSTAIAILRISNPGTNNSIKDIELKRFSINSVSTILKDIQINPNILDSNNDNRLYIQFKSNYSEPLKDLPYAPIITLSKRILSNTISDNQNLSSGQKAIPFTSNSPYIDYTIPCNRRGCSTVYDYRPITIFKWQFRTQNTNWTDVPGGISKDYSSTNTFTESTYYRRIAFYNDGLYDISNPISISINNLNIVNTICCDQNLPLASSQPKGITGNIPNLSKFTYQWQIATTVSTPMTWSDIIGATTQNYTHIFTTPATRGKGITSFRRLIKDNSFVINTSNTITIKRGNTAKISNNPKDIVNILNTPKDIINKSSELSVYPNPMTNYFYIENISSTNIEKINIFDQLGREINLNKTLLSDNLIQIDGTGLPAGQFIVKIEGENTVTKKIIKN